jgi:hypothetical protein
MNDAQRSKQDKAYRHIMRGGGKVEAYDYLSREILSGMNPAAHIHYIVIGLQKALEEKGCV